LWRRTGDRLRAAVAAARMGRLVGGLLIAIGPLDLAALRRPRAGLGPGTFDEAAGS
jgi:hypothetical protein